MAVNLCAIFNASSGQFERVHGPLQVSFALLACPEWEAFTERWLIDLNDVNTSSLKVDDLVSEGQCELLSLNRLMNIITWEGPSETSNRACEHTLHWLLRDRRSILRLFNCHGRRAGDVSN